ncbi:hypothetical protein [Brevirhabdus sp.]|uniref:hypothetical protein n=1 Tax=Brevirhabdus sp. TaxID=2004514 RepID=UPI004059BC0E
MIVKIVTLFLVGIAVLAMFGKFRVPGSDAARRLAQRRPGKCPRCGRYKLTRGPCDCRKIQG